MKKQQTHLFDYYETISEKKRYSRTQHGGVNTKGRRKLERPLSSRKWIHLVLKSDQAKGRFSFLNPKNSQSIKQILKRQGNKFGVKIADFANVGNHLHLKIKIKNRESFQKFLKSVTCLIARKITGATKTNPFGRFWQGLAFTRVLQSSLEVLNLKGYIQANRVQANRGEFAREKYLMELNRWVYLQVNSG